MATEDLERIVRYEADTTKAIAQLDALTDATRKNGQALDGVQDQLSGITKRIDFAAAFTGVKEVVTEVAGAVKEVIDQFDQLTKTAQQVGLSVQGVQELQYALQFAGLSSAQAASTMGRLSDKLADLDSSVNDTTIKLKAMGITSGDDVTTAMKKMADVFANMPDGVNKTAIAIDVFGKTVGLQMVPYLNQGSEAIEQLMADKRANGLVDEESARQAAAFNDELVKLQDQVAELGRDIVAELLPSLLGFAKWCNDVVPKVVKVINWLDEMNSKFSAGAIAARQFSIAAAGAGQDFGVLIAGLATFERNAKEDPFNQEYLALKKFGAQALATADAFALLPKKIRELQEQMSYLDPSVEKDALKLQSLNKQLEALQKQLDGPAPKKSGAGRRTKEVVSDFDRWIASMNKAQEGLADNDRKIEWLTERLKELNEVGEGGSDWAKRLRSELEKMQPDPVAAALAKINKELADFADNEKAIVGLTAELQRLRDAGLDASEYAVKVKDRLLELRAAEDPVARVTLQVQKLNKAMSETDATNRELLKRLMSNQIDGAVFDKLYKGAEKASDSLERMDKKTVSLADSIGTQLGSSITNWTDNLVDNMGRAQTSVSDFVESTIKALAKLVLNTYFQRVAQAFDSAGGFSGVFSGGGGKQAQGAAYADGVQFMARGGILDRPTLFGTSRGLAMGGEAGNEAVVPLRRSSSGDLGVGAAPTTINIYNNTDAQVTTATRDNTDGSRIVDVTIERKVRSMFAGGSMDNTMRASYGLSRQPVRG